MIGQQTIVTVEQNVHFERLLTNDKEMQKKMQKAVRTAVLKVRSALSKQAREGLDMNGDPKAAVKAIKSAVWKKMLGGNVSLLNRKRASGRRAPLPPVTHKLETQTNRKGNHRGGNRMPRSRRTEDLLTYYGSDRGFILRFLNQGTPNRSGNNTRRVGQIAASNWFGNASQQQLMKAAEYMEKLIEQAIQEADA